MGKICCPVYFNSQITLKQLKDDGRVLPGRHWAVSQLAGRQGRRLPFQWSQEEARLSPALPTASSASVVLRLSLNEMDGLFSFNNGTLLHSSALHLVNGIIWRCHQHCDCCKAPTWWFAVSNCVSLGTLRPSSQSCSGNFLLWTCVILMHCLQLEFRNGISEAQGVFYVCTGDAVTNELTYELSCNQLIRVRFSPSPLRTSVVDIYQACSMSKHYTEKKQRRRVRTLYMHSFKTCGAASQCNPLL